MQAWKRVLKVTLTSRKFKKSVTFGGVDGLGIDVSLYKYMSTLKDSASIHIDNLTYSEITQLLIGEFYDVSIQAGYESGNVTEIFNGGVLYISNKLQSDRTNTAIILCGSKLVAAYSQKRLNLTLNSGINMYSAINFICKMAEIPNSNVSTQFKKKFLEEVLTVNDTSSSWLDKLCESNEEYIVNSDSIAGQTFSIFDAALSNRRVIKLTNDNILLTNGYPRLTTTGLELTLLPSFNFMCGDVIEIDNSIVDVSVQSSSEISYDLGSRFSQKGQYMIYEMEYELQNRGSQFTLRLKCKNRDKITAYIGGST